MRGISRVELAALTGQTVDFPIIAYAMLTHRRRGVPIVVGIGGLCWRIPGEHGPRCDIWLDTIDRRRMKSLAHSRALVRWSRLMLKKAAQMGEREVFCFRDDEPNSAKLLTMIGLELAGVVDIGYADGTHRPGELWKWRNLQQ